MSLRIDRPVVAARPGCAVAHRRPIVHSARFEHRLHAMIVWCHVGGGGP